MSESYFCGNCWALTPRDDLSYRCLGCGDPSLPEWLRGTGQPRSVRDLLPPWYVRLFSGDKPLACPSHPTARLQLFCPACGAALSDASVVRRGKPLALGIAGPRTAGKTLFLIALIRELRRKQIGGRPLGLLGLNGTDERFGAIESELLQGKRPEKTDREQWEKEDTRTASVRNYCWQVQSAGSDRRGAPPAFLSVYDVAGESWGEPSDRALDRFDRYVATLTSLIFLIDGAAVARDLGYTVEDSWAPPSREGLNEWVDLQWLGRARERLDRRSREVDLALVLSKADCLWDIPDWQALRKEAGEKENQEALLRLLNDSGRNTLLATAHQSFRQVKLFTASSLGFRPGPQDVLAMGSEPPRLTRQISPAGVTDPALWLLGRRLPFLREEGGT